MVDNAEIVQCESQVKIGVKWNSSFVKMFWGVLVYIKIMLMQCVALKY